MARRSIPDQILPGFRPLGGTQRRYEVEGSGGQTISRRQYMRLANAEYRGETRTAYQINNARAQAIGYQSYGEYLKTRREYAPKWEKHREQMLNAGVPPGKLGAFSEAERLWRDVDRERATLPRNAIGQTNDHDSELLRDPHGPLAEILVLMGYRDKESNTPPGDSPIRHK